MDDERSDDAVDTSAEAWCESNQEIVEWMTEPTNPLAAPRSDCG
jgi:hypothetical protein